MICVSVYSYFEDKGTTRCPFLSALMFDKAVDHLFSEDSLDLIFELIFRLGSQR